MRITREHQTVFNIESKNPLLSFFIASHLSVVSKSSYEYGEYKGELLTINYPANLRTDRPLVFVQEDFLTDKETLNNPEQFKNLLHNLLTVLIHKVVKMEEVSQNEQDNLFEEDYFN